MNKDCGKKGWYLLFLIPFIGLLFPSLYSSVEPTLWGFPFFYWYQILWVLISSILTFIVYVSTKESNGPERK